MSSKKEKYLLIVGILAAILVAAMLIFSGFASTENKPINDNHGYSNNEYGSEEYGSDEYSFGEYGSDEYGSDEYSYVNNRAISNDSQN